MCGISAIFGHSESLRKDLGASLKKIRHRGNHTFESITFHSGALGANRLAIVDESNGKQPVSNEDQTIYAVQNGEIFNYLELRSELETKGHKFKTNCDTEILVHLWEEYGAEIVKKIDSEMFAFIIYDLRNGNIFIARDPIGVKPLYYAYDNLGRFLIASEIKQLSQFSNINEIKEFPPGHFYYKGEFNSYFSYPKKENNDTEEETEKKLGMLIEKAVRKRVQTNLPIGVFLSGGVDSSLIMELANRYHPNVTAIILGTNKSPDYINAVRLCKEKGWKYHAINPKPNYEQELENIIYHVESYEPLIIRHSFANNLVSFHAKKLGLKVVLVGEGSDELFGGYNEFAQLKSENINFGCFKLIESLSKGHLMRVDKIAMRHTIEIRSPFFDTEIIKYALTIPGKYKVVKKGKISTKMILRKVASKYLPDYIAYRCKAPFANGAGMKIGVYASKYGGILSKIANLRITNELFQNFQNQYPSYKLKTKEEAHNFKFYKKFEYTKFKDGEKRLLTKDNLITLNKEDGIGKLILEVLKSEYVDKKQTLKFNNKNSLRRVIEKASERKSLQIIGYWGVEKEKIDQYEIEAFNSLEDLREKLGKQGLDIDLTLILTDIHGIINNISQNTIQKYYNSVEKLAKAYQFKAIYLSELWKSKGLLFEDIIKKNTLIKSERVDNFLLKASKRHYKNRDSDYKEGALLYGQCSIYDADIVLRNYPGALFFTYNSAKWKNILPNLPIISLYGTGNNTHIKPWHKNHKTLRVFTSA